MMAGGGVGRPGDACAAPSAEASGIARRDEGLHSAVPLGGAALAQDARESEMADDLVGAGEGDLSVETAAAPRLAVDVAEASWAVELPQMRSPTARMMDLSSILSVETAGGDRENSAEEGEMDVDQSGMDVEKAVIAGGGSLVVEGETVVPQATQLSEPTGVNSQDYNVDPPNVPVGAEKDKEEQSASAATLEESTSAALDMRGHSGKLTTETVGSASLTGAANEAAAGPEHSAARVLARDSPVTIGNDATHGVASASARSTRSSRKKAPDVTASPKQAMYADLTLEMVSGGDDGTIAAMAPPSKKRSQQATKTAAVPLARAPKRSRTREKQTVVGADEENLEDDDDVVFVKDQPAPALPPRARPGKRRYTTEGSDQFEPPPIIKNPPPLPFKDHSSRRSSSHSASPSRGPSVDRECEFCKHSVDMCTLLVCKACRRAYHVRCLVKQFKAYWPSEGSIESRLKKLQEDARDRRVGLFRCSSCRAAFAEFVDTEDSYLAPCKCPTCVQPELLATFRRNKLVQMLMEMNKAKALGKQGVSSKVSTASVTSDASAESGSGEAKKSLVRGTSTDQDASRSTPSRGGAARRRSSRPVRRGAPGYSESDETYENSLEDMSTGFSTAENSPIHASAGMSSAVRQVAPVNSEAALAVNDASRALTDLSLVDLATNQPAPIGITVAGVEANGAKFGRGETVSNKKGDKSAKPKTSKGQTDDVLLDLIDLVVHREEKTVQFPVMCLRSQCDGSDTSIRSNQSRYFSVRKLKDSVIQRGQCLWKSATPVVVECSCCNAVFTLTKFAEHVGLSSPDAKTTRHYLMAVHRDGVTASKIDAVIRALAARLRSSPYSSFEAAFVPAPQHNSGMSIELSAQDQADIWDMKIPRKKKPAEVPAKPKNFDADPRGNQPHQDTDLLNNLNADIEREGKQRVMDDALTVEKATQQVREAVLVKRNRNSMMSQAIADPTDTDANPLDYLLKVVSLPSDFVGTTADGEKRDRMYNVPPGATKRRVGWLALSVSRRFSRLIYCECCEKALPVAEFISHGGMEPDVKNHLGLYVMNCVTPGMVLSFARFCKNSATIARAGGDQAFAAILEHLQ